MSRLTVRVQRNGQVTIPREIRERLGLKKGDVVIVTLGGDAVVVRPLRAVTETAMDQTAGELRGRGVTMEDLIETGRHFRGELLEKRYGLARRVP